MAVTNSGSPGRGRDSSVAAFSQNDRGTKSLLTSLYKGRQQAGAGQFYLGGSFPKLVGPNTGWFNAIDVGTGTFKWRHRYEQPNNGSALVTSSGLVFTGDLDGNFNAFDTKTGKMLWQYNTGSPIAAAPSEYTIGGTEYLAVASGPAGFVKDPATTDQNAGPMVTVFAAKD